MTRLNNSREGPRRTQTPLVSFWGDGHGRVGQEHRPVLSSSQALDGPRDPLLKPGTPFPLPPKFPGSHSGRTHVNKTLFQGMHTVLHDSQLQNQSKEFIKTVQSSTSSSCSVGIFLSPGDPHPEGPGKSHTRAHEPLFLGGGRPWRKREDGRERHSPSHIKMIELSLSPSSWEIFLRLLADVFYRGVFGICETCLAHPPCP